MKRDIPEGYTSDHPGLPASVERYYRELGSMGYSNWRTDRREFEKLNEEFNFTIDLAASHANALLPEYCTLEGRFKRYPKNLQDDGGIRKLTQHNGLSSHNWRGERAYVNAPYDSNLIYWVQLANLRIAEVSVLVLPPSIETRWFHKLFSDGSWWLPYHLRYDETDDYTSFIWSWRELRFYKYRWQFLVPKDRDENNVESVIGDNPRTGNLVVITYGKAKDKS